MNTFRFFIACAALAACGIASAQYQWVDKDGRKIYSDRPPPADVPQKNILKQPRGSAPPAPRIQPAPGSEAEAPPVAEAPAPAASAPGVDKALQEQKRQAEAAQAARKKEEEQRVAALRAENCQRALATKASLDSGIRMARMNSKGEREIMEDADRAAELQRTQAIIQSDCTQPK